MNFEKRKRVADLIHSFIPRNCSTSTMGSRVASDLQAFRMNGAYAESVIRDLFADAGKEFDVNSLPPLPQTLKKSVARAFRQLEEQEKCNIIDYSKKVNGVHPVHKALVECMINHINAPNRKVFYNWAMDKEADPDVLTKSMANIPDLYCGTSKKCTDIDFLYELKLLDDTELAIKQAATYALEVMLVNLELTRSLADKFKFRFFGSNGISLAAGVITIDLNDVKKPIVCRGSLSYASCLPMTAADERNEPIAIASKKYALDLDSVGVKALYAVLHLSQSELGYGVPQYPSIELNESTSVVLLKILGRGSFATVYEGQCGNARVALKTNRYMPYTKETEYEDFQLEYDILKSFQILENPTLPVLYEVQADEGGPMKCIVFDHVDVLLSTYLSNLTKPERRSFALAMKLQLESAVEAVYGLPERYCHTDVRPANITVRITEIGEQRASPVLIDWGLAVPENTLVDYSERGEKAYLSSALIDSTDAMPVNLDYDYYAICSVCAASTKIFTPHYGFSKVKWGNEMGKKADELRSTLFTELELVVKTK